MEEYTKYYYLGYLPLAVRIRITYPADPTVRLSVECVDRGC